MTFANGLHSLNGGGDELTAKDSRRAGTGLFRSKGGRVFAGMPARVHLGHMKRRKRALLVMMVGASVLVACGERVVGTPARYLYVWAGDEDGKQSDFMSVFDVNPSSAQFGQVISTTPVGMSNSMPHHLEYQLPAEGEFLFGNAHHHETVFLFDTRDSTHPTVARTLPSVPPLRYPHDFIRLPNGNLLVGYLRSNGASPLAGDTTMPGGHGGIAEFTPQGELVRWRSAADSTSTSTVPIRPYAFALLPALDRFVVTSALMMEDTSASVVQIWRMSDLSLLRTLTVPEAIDSSGKPIKGSNGLPFEPRVLPDGSVFFNSYYCGFYRLTDVANNPTITPVYGIDMPDAEKACGVPLLIGKYWIMAIGRLNSLVTLDLSDPTHPREVQRLYADSVFRPHWLAYDEGGRRVVVGAENGGESRMLMADFDPATGKLAWNEKLRGKDGTRGLSFTMGKWPHGESGAAYGHAAVFRK
ncbi:MAG: hypothetical protein H7Z40_15440 [Phycisphaerae bacterium]|nr:hypothetical protein [Gemmatimonadaceae bacterium]